MGRAGLGFLPVTLQNRALASVMRGIFRGQAQKMRFNKGQRLADDKASPASLHPVDPDSKMCPFEPSDHLVSAVLSQTLSGIAPLQRRMLFRPASSQ